MFLFQHITALVELIAAYINISTSFVKLSLSFNFVDFLLTPGIRGSKCPHRKIEGRRDSCGRLQMTEETGACLSHKEFMTSRLHCDRVPFVLVTVGSEQAEERSFYVQTTVTLEHCGEKRIRN